jgi:hypothetical protein
MAEFSPQDTPMTSQFRYFVLCALSIVFASPASAGVIGISRFDNNSESVRRFDTNGNALGSFAGAGLNLVHDLSFDSTTGILYGLQRDAPGGSLFLSSWASDGSLLNFQNLGLAGSPTAGDAELTVHAGIVAISRFDSNGEAVRRFDTSGNALGSYAGAGLNLVHDLSFDSTTGILYGLQRDAPGGSLFLSSWASDGSLLNFQNLGLAGSPTAGDAELTVHAGIVAISRFDSNGEAVRRFDTSGNALGSYAGAGLNLVHDLSFDSTTGILYGLQRDVPGGSLYLSSWASDGSLLNFQNLGLAGSPTAGDAELAVFTPLAAVPEPTSLAIWSIGLLGTAVRRVRRRAARD